MAKVVNLRTRRKQAARDAERKDAGARAARHGLTKDERSLIEARADKAARDLDAHRREGSQDTPIDSD